MGRALAKKRKAECAPGPVRPLFDEALRRIAIAGIYAGLLAPLVAVKGVTENPFTFLTTLFLQATIALTVPAFLLLAWRQPAFRPRRAWLSIALVAYFAALALSCVFAFNRYRAFWGAQNRMGGLFSLAHFFVWYVMATSLLRTWRDWRRLFHWEVALGFFAALGALFELRDPNVYRISGVFGNPIPCGGYQLLILGILALLWMRSRSAGLRTVYAVCALVSLVTLVFTGSRGPLLGLASGLTVVAIVWAATGRHWRWLVAMLGVLLVAGVGYAGMVRMQPSWPQHPGLQHLFSKNTNELRPIIWSTALAGFRDHPLIGWGPDNFEAISDVHFQPRYTCAGAYTELIDTAHSLLFEHLAATGMVGTLAFAAVWVALVLSLWRAYRQRWLEARAFGMLLGLSAAYLVQGQFMTDGPSSHSMLFLLLAVTCAAGFPDFAAEASPKDHAWAIRSAGPAALAMAALQTGGVLLAWQCSVVPVLASYSSLQAIDALKQGGCGAMLESVRRTAAIATPWSEDQFTVVSKVLSEIVNQDKLEVCPQWRSLYDLARQKGVVSYAGRPEHFRFSGALPSLAHILGLKSHDPSLLSEAQQLYEALIEGSPQRQLYHYRLAELFTETTRIEAAGDQLMQAFNADPEIGESTWRLGVFHWRYGNQAELGSRMVVQSVNGTCPRGLSGSGEAILLARAFLLQGDLEGLRSMELRLAQLPPEYLRSASVYLEVARLQEQAGLLAERDRMVRAAAARDAALSARLAPLIEGRLRTIAEAEGVAALAATTP